MRVRAAGGAWGRGLGAFSRPRTASGSGEREEVAAPAAWRETERAESVLEASRLWREQRVESETSYLTTGPVSPHCISDVCAPGPSGQADTHTRC